MLSFNLAKKFAHHEKQNKAYLAMYQCSGVESIIKGRKWCCLFCCNFPTNRNRAKMHLLWGMTHLLNDGN